MRYKHIAQLYRDRAKQYTDKIALYFWIEKEKNWNNLTWNQFIELINKTSLSLINNDIKHQEHIGIFSRNMPEWTICDIAIMSTGAVVVPIYATDSKDQAAYILNSSNIKTIFVGEQEQFDKVNQLNQTHFPDLKIIVFEKETNLKNNKNACYFEDFIKQTNILDIDKLQSTINNLNIEDLATVIYTSGTSGEPKGVMLKHKNFLNAFKIHDEVLSISEKDVSLAFLPFSHIFERTWTLIALHNGMTNYYFRNPKDVVQMMQMVKPTIMCAVPRFFEKTYSVVMHQVEGFSSFKKSMFNWALKVANNVMELKRQEKPVSFIQRVKFSIADALVLKKGRMALGGKIRFMPCAGAALPDDINIFFQSVGVHIKYAYGLTETIATVTLFKDTKFKFGTVGVNMPGVQVKIGEDNEILIKGDSLFCGYYNKPEETQKAFVDGWFRSGDAGEIDEEGYLIMKERIKDLFKTSSGKFIAPQQLESLLSTDPHIENIVVIGDDKKFVAALIVPSFKLIENFAKNNNISISKKEDLIKHPKIIELIDVKLNKLQENLAEYQKVKRFALLSNEFTIDGGEYTTTLKTRRKFINEKYKTQIEEIYSE